MIPPNPFYTLCDFLADDPTLRLNLRREQWLDDAGLSGEILRNLQFDVPAATFVRKLLSAAARYDEIHANSDKTLRAIVRHWQDTNLGQANVVDYAKSLLEQPNLREFLFPHGIIDGENPLPLALARFARLPLETIPDPATLPTPYHMPFDRNADFVGREMEMMAMAEGIKTGQGAVVAAGIGGVGKTQLTVEFVHRYGRYFQGGVFWLDFSDPASIPLSIAAAGTVYQKPGYDQMELAAKVVWVREQWKSEVPTLLIFDNCEDPKLVDEYAPIGSGARVLVTSRDQTWEQSLRSKGIRQVSIDTLPDSDSIKLLRRLCDSLGEGDAKSIAEELGNLPLALHIAGSYLEEYKNTEYGNPINYVEQIRQISALLQLEENVEWVDGDTPTKHIWSVRATFMLSLQRLREAPKVDSRVVEFFLHLLAQFAPGVPVPTEWLKRGKPDEVDARVWVKAQNQALKVGLADTLKRGNLRMHRLVVEVVKEVLQDKIMELDIIQNIILIFAPKYGQDGFAVDMELWLSHAQYIANNSDMGDVQLAILGNEIGDRLHHLALYDKTLIWYQKSFIIRRNTLGNFHPDTATSISNLATLYKAQGIYDQAQPLFEEALNIQRSLLGSKHPFVATISNNLALLYLKMGKYKDALPLIQESLDIRYEIFELQHISTASSLNDLAGAYVELGMYDNALPLYKQALFISKAILPENHPQIATILNNLGGLYNEKGYYKISSQKFEEALKIYRKSFSDNHPQIANTMGNLAGVYINLSRYDLALPLCQEALSIRRQILQPNHPDIATSLNGLALLYKRQKSYKQALPLYEEALLIQRKSLGINHLGVAITLNNLGELYRVQKEYDKALQLLEEALKIGEDVLGVSHPGIATTLSNLALVHELRENYSTALDYYKRTLSILNIAYGSNHPDTKQTIRNWINCLTKIQRER